MFRAVLASLAGGALAAALLQPTSPAAGDDVLPYQDAGRPTSVRVADLLDRMTLA
jgi:beta-glucosidase